jgi:SAM-dependent methyltransferase
MDKDKIKKTVRDRYAKTVTAGTSCCGDTGTSRCGGNGAEVISKEIGYSKDDLSSVPDGANLGLGCGNPIALASLKEGETVIDLGSGAGFDCFLASPKVGKSGKVIGVDMTFEMIEKARQNAKSGSYENVEFRLSEIENLPVADNTGDIIISNCVINLSPAKDQVFAEAFRVLKPGGRMMISDLVLNKELPDEIRNSVNAYVGCIAGAALKDEYLSLIKEAGFENVEIVQESYYPVELDQTDPLFEMLGDELKMTREEFVKVASETVASVKISAQKPK